MNDKSKRGTVLRWWRQITRGGMSDNNTRYCEKGHPMDPNWTSCAYCDAESRGRQKTASQKPASENTDRLDAFKPDEHSGRRTAMEPENTRIDSGAPKDARGGTQIDTSSDTFQGVRARTHKRKITGVLVTFSWRFEGELFVLYEGRNVIGSANSCDIQVSTDPSMSGEHAVILCRAGRDELHDLLSTNGTFINEKYVERDGADVVDGAFIKTGGTVFEFRKITSGPSKAPLGERGQNVEEDDFPTRRSGETAI